MVIFHCARGICLPSKTPYYFQMCCFTTLNSREQCKIKKYNRTVGCIKAGLTEDLQAQIVSPIALNGCYTVISITFLLYCERRAIPFYHVIL